MITIWLLCTIHGCSPIEFRTKEWCEVRISVLDNLSRYQCYKPEDVGPLWLKRK